MRRAYVGIAESHSVIVFPLEALDRGAIGVDIPGAYALRLRIDIAENRPTDFAWGDAGVGSSHLALAILADYLDDYRRAERWHVAFRQQAIERLPADKNFVLLPDDVERGLDWARLSEALDTGGR